MNQVYTSQGTNEFFPAKRNRKNEDICRRSKTHTNLHLYYAAVYAVLQTGKRVRQEEIGESDEGIRDGWSKRRG